MNWLRNSLLIGFLLCAASLGFSQNGMPSYRFWNQELFSGEIGARAHYRSQYRSLASGFEERMNGTLFGGHFLLKSRSFIVHPNLMEIDFEGEYNPEKIGVNYTTIPDRSDVRTLSRLNLQTTFFREKPISLSAFYNMGRNYINRENFTNSLTRHKSFGGGVFYKNKVLPVSVSYEERYWDQQDLETVRYFNYWQRSIRAETKKSFFEHDHNRLKYSFNDYIRTEYNLELPRQNKVHQIDLISNIPFDHSSNYILNTYVSNYNQRGDDDLNRLAANTNLTMNLPRNFRLNALYGFNGFSNPIYDLNQHRGQLSLSHQLFESLRTSVNGMYISSAHTIYDEKDVRAGFEIDYTKRIPADGRLRLFYSFQNRYLDRRSDPMPYFVTNEEHTLADDKITLLDQPYVDLGSIVVKDVTGTIIYQQGLDYLLFEQNNYVEIRRIPGGMIPNNGKVLVDYTTVLLGSYTFNQVSQAFSVSLSFFNQFVEVYYKWAKQDYSYIEASDLLILNYYLQNIVGVEFRVGFMRFGVEYNDYQSNIIPYQQIRAHADMQFRFKQRLLFSVLGNMRYYLTIADRTDELYADLSARFAYQFSRRTKLTLELMYREQQGYQINMNYLTARTELNMTYRKLFIKIGAEFYRRDYLNRETINFNGGYITVMRKFNRRF